MKQLPRLEHSTPWGVVLKPVPRKSVVVAKKTSKTDSVELSSLDKGISHGKSAGSLSVSKSESVVVTAQDQSSVTLKQLDEASKKSGIRRVQSESKALKNVRATAETAIAIQVNSSCRSQNLACLLLNFLDALMTNTLDSWTGASKIEYVANCNINGLHVCLLHS